MTACVGNIKEKKDLFLIEVIFYIVAEIILNYTPFFRYLNIDQEISSLD